MQKTHHTSVIKESKWPGENIRICNFFICAWRLNGDWRTRPLNLLNLFEDL